jgi:hypothetical protein
MRYAETARAREAGNGPGESFTPPEKAPATSAAGGPPDVSEELINARRALRTARFVIQPLSRDTSS